MKNSHYNIFIIVFFTFSFSVFANVELSDKDFGSLSGFVKDATTKETLIGATLFIEGTKLGSRTNKNGYFAIPKIEPNEYNVRITYMGYKTLIVKLKFKADENIKKEFFLEPSSISTDEINIVSDREEDKREISVSKVDIPINVIKNIRVGGESDIFRTIQFLPGVLTSSQISSGLFIRGGSPDQNLVLLDGATVYNPTHLFGFISTFNSDALKNAELIKGGYPPEYGGRLSAVLNITQKDGNRENVSGVASIGVISSRLGLEGPTPWEGGSWFVSARRTYLDLILEIIPDDPESPFPDFGFYDLNAKIVQNFGMDDKVSVSGFVSKDYLDFSGRGMNMQLSLGNNLISSKWIHIFNEHIFSTVLFSYSKYFNSFIGSQSGYGFIFDNIIADYSGKAEIEWMESDDFTFKLGGEVSYFDFQYIQNFTGETDTTLNDSYTGINVNDMQSSAFAQINYKFTDLFSFQTGLRVNYWQLSDLLTFDPRISFKYILQDNIRLKLAVGTFHQNLRLASQPDFSFFDTWLPTDSTVPASKSDHYIFTLETEPAIGYDLNFDVYYKNFENVSELNMNTLEGKKVSDIFYIGNAYAWGAEVFLQKKFGKLNGWVGYAIGFINSKFDSINNGEMFRPKYDRTHDFKIVLNYELNDTWSFGTSFFFQTGQSYTGVTSRAQVFMPDQNKGRAKVFNSQRFGLRLPPSHQLNISATYKFSMWGLPAKTILDVYNVYSRRDILVRFYNTREDEATVEDVRLIPIIPTLSLEVTF